MTGLRFHNQGNNGEAPPRTIGQRYRRDGRQKIQPMDGGEALPWWKLALSVILPLALSFGALSLLGWL